MRCAFCPAPAECKREPTNVPPPCCWDCRPLSKAVYREVDALRGGKQLEWAGAWHRRVWGLRDVVIARDAAEQRGEPADASGWVLF